MAKITEIALTSEVKTQLQGMNNKQLRVLLKLATGQRVNSPRDDPPAAGRAVRLNEQKAGVVQNQKGAEYAKAVSEESASAVDMMHKVMVRSQEIASQTNNELGGTSFGPFAKEVNQQIEELLNLGNTMYLGKPVFAGTKTDANPFSATRDGTGKVTAVSYVGNTSVREFHISETTKLSPFLDWTTNNSINTALGNLISLRDALEASNPAGVVAVEASLRTSEQNMITAIATIGGTIVREAAAQLQNDDSIGELNKQISNGTSVDFASTITDYKRTLTAYEGVVNAAQLVLQQPSLLNYL